MNIATTEGMFVIGTCTHPSHAPVVPMPTIGYIEDSDDNVLTPTLTGAAHFGSKVSYLCGHEGYILEGDFKHLNSKFLPTAYLGATVIGMTTIGTVVMGDPQLLLS